MAQVRILMRISGGNNILYALLFSVKNRWLSTTKLESFVSLLQQKASPPPRSPIISAISIIYIILKNNLSMDCIVRWLLQDYFFSFQKLLIFSIALIWYSVCCCTLIIKNNSILVNSAIILIRFLHPYTLVWLVKMLKEFMILLIWNINFLNSIDWINRSQKCF